MKKRIVVLGSTGSIGENTMAVLRALPERFEVYGLAAATNAERLGQQVAEFHCPHAVIADINLVDQVKKHVPECQVTSGTEALTELVSSPDVDIILCAIVGTGSLLPVLRTLELGKTVALASKEILVMAGELVMAAAKRGGGKIIPVDSEHSAIFQCLLSGNNTLEAKRLILTASGGAFRETPLAELKNATVKQALNHPAWSMGPKVTIDSATMMNKALEVIEAYFLFGIPFENIDVLVHPQAIVHSLVEFTDGCVIAQMSEPDMRLPIQYALTWPERCNGGLKRLNLAATGSLDFANPCPERYPALELGYTALRCGGTMPAVLNAANEAAVELFRSGEIGYTDICKTIKKVMAEHCTIAAPNLEQIMAADAWARTKVEAMKLARA
ncbi:MAG: 1-deoxy-D-xylulose-5-phosphate reductoisomerase [Victivallaceae bacterium]|nr:1-deoxy-D-xylulose-5-phosphate reductoisomerase [Victivallaceae bacterium]